jgi:hypothetical protein
MFKAFEEERGEYKVINPEQTYLEFDIEITDQNCHAPFTLLHFNVLVKALIYDSSN